MPPIAPIQTAVPKYVHEDDQGVLRVGAAAVQFDGIVAAFELGDSPDSILSQYPALTLEEVYGAITFYLAHRTEVVEYLKRQDEVWRYWRSRFEQNPSSLLQKLRDLKATRAQGST
jgi:hypothetical protein